MSNPAYRYETSILFAWYDGDSSTVMCLQLLRDGRIAKVDENLTVLEYMTVEEARALKASIGEDPNGYWGSPPKAKFHLATHNPLMN